MSTTPLSLNFIFTAGEADAAGLMPPSLLVRRMIEIATLHANSLGIGYDRLIRDNAAWVLSRISFNLERSPEINESYTITTRIDSWNRLFSVRSFTFTGADGGVIGHGVSIWAAIDIDRRTPADLTPYAAIAPPAEPSVDDRPVTRPPRLGPIPDERISRRSSYTVTFADLDYNRHVNSARYVEHILNLWPLDHYDTMRPAALDIAYHHEASFGQTLEFVVENTDATDRVDIVCDSRRILAASITWKPI